MSNLNNSNSFPNESDLEIQKSVTNTSDLKFVYARKLNTNQSFNFTNSNHHNNNTVHDYSTNENNINDYSMMNSLGSNDQKEFLNSNLQILGNTTNSNRIDNDKPNTPVQFKFNPSSSAFRAYDSPKDNKKHVHKNVVHNEQIKNKPFSVTPGPQRSHQIESIKANNSKLNDNLNENNGPQFQLFYHQNDKNDPSFIIPMNHFSNHNSISNYKDHQMIKESNFNEFLPTSPDIIDIVRDVITNESSKYPLNDDNIYPAFNPSLKLFNESTNNKKMISDYNISTLTDLDICNTAKDLGTLNLYNSASYAKDFTQTNNKLPTNNNNNKMRDDLNYLYSSVDSSDSYSTLDAKNNINIPLHLSYELHQHNVKDLHAFSFDKYAIRELNQVSNNNSTFIKSSHDITTKTIITNNPLTYHNQNNELNLNATYNNYQYENNSIKGNQRYQKNKSKPQQISNQESLKGSTNIFRTTYQPLPMNNNEIINKNNQSDDIYGFNEGSSATSKLAPTQDFYFEPKIHTKESHLKSNQSKENKHGKNIPPLSLQQSSQVRSSNQIRTSKDSQANNLQSSIDSESSLASKFMNRLHIDHSMKSSKENPIKVTNSINSNKQEPIESPRSKTAYKDFYKKFKQKDKDSYEDAKLFALNALLQVPENTKWRIYLELADCSKRNNQLQEARHFYSEACLLQPKANLSWLEWSKMEEENGKLRTALNILLLGLKVCKINESLLTRIIKLHERLHKYSEVRGMLSILKYESIDRVWKSVLEGTLFEARTGNILISRKLFKYLMNYVSWYGPIYYEAFRLEEKEDNDIDALKIIRKGLKELPKYGPLWLGLLRIMEREDVKLEYRSWQQGCKPQLIYLNKETDEAVRMISKELTWKIYFEKSQAEERAAEIASLSIHMRTNKSLFQCRDELFEDSRKSLLRSLLICPSNLRWKIFLVGARLELSVNNIEKSRLFLIKAFQEVPLKSKSNVFIECSRLEEFLGNVDLARKLLITAQQDINIDWKVSLEMILLEARAGFIEKAALLAKDAVDIYAGTGRLWAMYIQLCHRLEFIFRFKNNDQNLKSLNDLEEKDNFNSNKYLIKELVMKRAITEVPKSGEVWCERGRCYMNPLNINNFDLSHIQRCLCFAIQFTPQYGDTFIEFIRLELLCQVLLPKVLEVLKLPIISFLKSYLYEDMESDIVEMTRDFRCIALFHTYNNDIKIESIPNMIESERIKRCLLIKEIDKMEYDFGNLTIKYKNVVLKNLFRRCVNADPNYGFAWFYCRNNPYDIPNYVLENAKHKIIHELTETQNIYAKAIFYYIYRTCYKQFKHIRNSDQQNQNNTDSFNSINDNSIDLLNNSQLSSNKNKRPGSAPSQRSRNNLNISNQTEQDIISKSFDSSIIKNKSSFLYQEDHIINNINLNHDETLTMIGGKKSPFRKDMLLNNDDLELYESYVKEESNDISFIQMNEFIEDITIALPNVASNEYNKQNISTASSHILYPSKIIPFVQQKQGLIHSYTDFVTGIIELNQIIFNKQLDLELKRKVLFGTDSILS